MAEIAILSRHDYDRIKNNSLILSKEIISSSRDDFRVNHKKRLIDIDFKKSLKASQENSSEFEIENIKKKNNLLTQAKTQIEEQFSVVKEMNKIMLYSQVRTIRDRQREENKKIVNIFKQQDNKMDILMEIERLKDLQLFEERDNIKKIIQKNGKTTHIYN